MGRRGIPTQVHAIGAYIWLVLNNFPLWYNMDIIKIREIHYSPRKGEGYL